MPLIVHIVSAWTYDHEKCMCCINVHIDKGRKFPQKNKMKTLRSPLKRGYFSTNHTSCIQRRLNMKGESLWETKLLQKQQQ